MGFNGTIFGIGVLLIIFSYLIGVKKQTWLLSGFNQNRIRDKEKLYNGPKILDTKKGDVKVGT
ncbi:hypothetical protein [Virgibacillus ihumii]|uniref:hypothetical protein n=1 Tax=Virgibacillus ihumii TaxID=2686091 RepID=UPI00157C21BB|nr:hypothetical protein [Virgibacillus ihumii]